MNCYLIKQDIFNKNGFKSVGLNSNQKIILENAKNLSNELSDVKGTIKFYCEDKIESVEVMLLFKQILAQKHMILDENIIIDSKLNEREIKSENLFLDKEKKIDFKNRVFDAIAEIIMSSNEEDIIVLVVGDQVIDLMQRDEDIHALTYFGDERIPDFRSVFIDQMIINGYGFDTRSMIDSPMLRDFSSHKKIESIMPTKITLEQPIFENSGIIKPVYIKYAEQEAHKKTLKKETQPLK